MKDDGEATVDRHRLDKWLWFTRFFKTRAMATDAVAGGKVHVNGERVKPAHNIRIGDRITLQIQGALGEFDVVGLPARRGPASEAQSHYAEPAASVQRRATIREQHRLANLSRPRPEGRPDKRDRRLLVKLQRDQE